MYARMYEWMNEWTDGWMTMMMIEPIRGQTGLRGWEEATVTTGAHCMHACM